MAFAAAFTSVAHADGMSANVALTSNYKFRGQDQGSNKPALQGGFDFSSSGFYVGNWNSSIGFTNSGLEMDFYAGYKGEAAGLGYDVGVLQYYYPQKAKTTDFNTTELYGAVTFSILTAKYSHTVSKDYFGLGEVASAPGGPRLKGRNTGYLDLSANYEIAKGVVLNGHVGYTNFSEDLDDASIPNYTDYKVGATYDMGSGFSLAGAVVGATKKSFYGDINKSRFILTLSKSM
jgi:uncharacterized protein (TIGR02001 family)